jgi:hypothetical protein
MGYLSAMAETFGVFVPGNSTASQKKVEAALVRQGWPAASAISGQDKVLICLGALERVREEMRSSGMDTAVADELAHRFSVGVLVHEHFHSAVAHGLDLQGRASLGMESVGAWSTALHLNESLAAWTERHLFRDDAEMVRRIDTYIRQGEYPAWPYRGAETIEAEYAQGGVPAVRTWIRYLRDDPENAQAAFDRRRSEIHSEKL